MAELNVKVGDKVIVSSRNGDYITTVERITPSGRIKTKEGYAFRSDGSQIGGDPWYTMHMYEYAEERAQKIMKKMVIDKAYSKMRRINYDDITYEMARDFLDILQKYKNKEE